MEIQLWVSLGSGNWNRSFVWVDLLALYLGKNILKKYVNKIADFLRYRSYNTILYFALWNQFYLYHWMHFKLKGLNLKNPPMFIAHTNAWSRFITSISGEGWASEQCSLCHTVCVSSAPIFMWLLMWWMMDNCWVIWPRQRFPMMPLTCQYKLQQKMCRGGGGFRFSMIKDVSEMGKKSRGKILYYLQLIFPYS